MEEKKNSMGKWGLVVAVVLVVVFGMYKLFTSGGGESTGNTNSGDTRVEFKESQRVKGAADAKVTIVEFADFQCPACATYSGVVEQVLEKYPNDVQLVYKHFPLIQVHKNSVPSARAAEAAGEQGKFWEMHDVLFDKQTEWSEAGNPQEEFEKYAIELGLDMNKFKEDLSKEAVTSRVDNDKAEGNGLRISSTPTFFINGKLVSVRATVEAFSEVIDAELASGGN